MSTRDEEEQQRRKGHKGIIDESWRLARQSIVRAEASDLDPTRALWPTDPSRGVWETYQRALGAHTAIIQFRDDIYAYRKKTGAFDVEELWQKEVVELQPVDEEYEISLADLDNWASQYTTVTKTSVSSVRGEETVEKQFRILLPIAACRQLYRQLQDVLQELGMTAPTEDRTPRDDPDGDNLVALLRARDQDVALENIPDRFKEGLEK